ncbi:UPF0688 protein C1orf174 homolog isoform X1 [Lates calcarifer]|uniref:UPF0688 protein C1orf174 homolog isoform X1 n=1 Tax=Lates calcarifer TaxID=8187 RepID=A0A4W6G8Q6_LATCA|nr:UPF0688 protein C1orf174 homolog isoform X1 [Lates calcarifer]
MQKAPEHLDNMKPRKRKNNSEVRGSRKASASRRRCVKSPKAPSAAETSSHPVDRDSTISCECHQSAGRRRCSASPQLEGQDRQDGQEGKENELRMGQDLEGFRLNGVQDKPEQDHMDYEESSKNIFPDDDSNQILPVEQFFGNLDVVQDFPQRSSVNSGCLQRENRRRHYYAREDSDEEEEVFIRDIRGGT